MENMFFPFIFLFVLNYKKKIKIDWNLTDETLGFPIIFL